MDIEDIESTLDALRKLYGLLGKDGDTSLDINSNTLDDKSRLLLKHLLDMAAKKVFKAHPEEVVGQVGLSWTQHSTQPLQLSDGWKQLPPALLNQSEISPVIQNSGNDLDNFDYKYTKTTTQETPPTQPMLGAAASLYGRRNKCCRICKRRIAKQSTLCDPKFGTKIIRLRQLNNQIDNFPESSRSTEKENQKGLHGLDQTAIGSMDFSLDRPATSTTKSTEEFAVIDSLSEESSNVIKKLELCFQNLKIGFGSSGLYTSTSGPIDSIPQNELSDRISDFVPQSESGNPVVEAKSPVATGTGWGQIGYSVADSGDPIHQTVNEQHKDSSPQCQVPSKTMSQQMEMKLPNQNSVQPLKPLPPKNSMMSPKRRISSQGGDPLHEDKELNQSVDWVFGQNVKSIVAKIESLNQAMQNDLMPSETNNFKCLSSNSNIITDRVPALNGPMQNDVMPSKKYNFKSLSPNNYMNSEKVPALVTWLPNQINKENLREKQSILDDRVRRPRACQPSGLSRVPGDYLLCGTNIQTNDTSCKVNQTWKAQSKRNLPSQVFKGHTHLDNRTPQYAGYSKWMDEEQVGNLKKTDNINPSRKISHHKQEYDDTCLNSSSSDWRSQQVSTSNCESEEYYVPGWKQRQKYGSPAASSESGVYSLRRRHQWHPIDTNSSWDEYSSTSCDRGDGDYELTSIGSNESNESGEYSLPSSATTDRISSIGDSESKRYSLHGQPRFQHHKQPRYFQMNLTSKKTGSTRFRKQSIGINPKKQVGTWKKLKDKLSIIFHHHHHHHHHHHDPDEDGRNASNHKSRISRGKYLSKRMGKTPPPVRLEVYGGQAVEKLGKPLINSFPRKNQHHHFNGLVGGLFRHIRHFKKSEIPAENIKHLGKGQHEGKKPWKKQHWWQMLQRQRQVKKGLGYKEKSTKRFSKIK